MAQDMPLGFLPVEALRSSMSVLVQLHRQLYLIPSWGPLHTVCVLGPSGVSEALPQPRNGSALQQCLALG